MSISLKIYTYINIYRSSCQTCSILKAVFRNFAKFKGKHLCQRPEACNFIKKDSHRCFPVNFTKFLRAPYLYRTPPDDCFFM